MGCLEGAEPCAVAGSGPRLLGESAVAEDPGDEPAEALVEPVDQGHHDDDEREHDACVAEQFTPSGRDHLLQLIDDLSKKECDAREGSTPFGALPLGARDEVLTRILDHLACHSQHLSTGNSAISCGVSQGGQDLNLQPAVLETAALPIEPPPYSARTTWQRGHRNAGTTKLGRLHHLLKCTASSPSA